MGAEHRNGPLRDVSDIFDESSALRAQTLDNVPVVHDLVPNVDGRAVDLQGALDDVDGTDDSGAEPSWLREQHMHRLLGQVISPGIDGMRRFRCSPLY